MFDHHPNVRRSPAKSAMSLNVRSRGEEAYITADVDLAKVRHARRFSRNFQQRRPELYEPLTSAEISVGNRVVSERETEEPVR